MAEPIVTVRQLRDMEQLHVELEGGSLGAYVGEPEPIARLLSTEGFRELARHISKGTAPVAYLEIIGVPEDKRGRGIGTKMLEAALEALRDVGIRYVYVHASPHAGYERKLIYFFKRFGFERIPFREGHLIPMKADLRARKSLKSSKK